MPSLDCVIVDRRDFFRAREDAGRRLERRARRDRLLLAEEIGLVVDRLHGSGGREARLDRGGLIGDDRRAPIFVGEAKPAAVALEGSSLAGRLVDRRVGDSACATLAPSPITPTKPSCSTEYPATFGLPWRRMSP